MQAWNPGRAEAGPRKLVINHTHNLFVPGRIPPGSWIQKEAEQSDYPRKESKVERTPLSTQQAAPNPHRKHLHRFAAGDARSHCLVTQPKHIKIARTELHRTVRITLHSEALPGAQPEPRTPSHPKPIHPGRQHSTHAPTHPQLQQNSRTACPPKPQPRFTHNTHGPRPLRDTPM